MDLKLPVLFSGDSQNLLLENSCDALNVANNKGNERADVMVSDNSFDVVITDPPYGMTEFITSGLRYISTLQFRE
jgi:DNA modification methylase